MRTIDPAYLSRVTVGFDALLDDLRTSVTNTQAGYPPHNVVKLNEDQFVISLAVAGFANEDLTVTKDKNILTIEGSQNKPDSDGETVYLYKGIGTRKFRRQFTLAEHVEVESAKLDLGILNVYLVRNVPEEAKPKVITIG